MAKSAWTPLVMISGIASLKNEFETPYRIINDNISNSLWNDARHWFQNHACLWRKEGTDEAFECTKLIASTLMIKAVKRSPAYVAMETDHKKNQEG